MLKKETNKSYHSNYDYLSSSFVSKCSISPLHAIQKTETTSEAMMLGSIYHSLIEGIEDYVVIDLDERPEPTKRINSKLNSE